MANVDMLCQEMLQQKFHGDLTPISVYKSLPATHRRLISSKKNLITCPPIIMHLIHKTVFARLFRVYNIISSYVMNKYV